MSLEAEIAKIPDRVDRGIKFLYETYGYDVFERINIESVDFKHGQTCIGGQLHSDRVLPNEFYDQELGFIMAKGRCLTFDESRKYLDALHNHWKQELEKDEILSGFGIL